MAASLQQRFRVWGLRLRSIARKETVDTELSRELQFHFDELVAEHVAAGLSPELARRAAHRALGNFASIEEACRDERRVNWVHDLRQDLIYGVRMLRRQPGFTFVAAASLALGIGANAAVLGAMDTLMLRGLPVNDAGRLIAIQSAPIDQPSQRSGTSLAEYAAYRDRSHVFETLDVSIRWASALTGDATTTVPERVQAMLVTPGWLAMLGIQPAMGRVFTAAESGPGSAPVVVVGDGFWRRRFGGDPDIVNKTVRINGAMRTIVGVMPASFHYQAPDIDCWMPLYVPPAPDAGARLFAVRGRLKPGVSIAQVQADLDRIAGDLATERPSQQQGWGARVSSLSDFLFGWTGRPLITLEAAVALVLLIACANVAALLLSRGSTRQREVALRVALGAGRARILRQLMTESLLLALLGGVLGIVVAQLGLRALIAMTTPPGAPPLSDVGLGWRVISLLACLTLVTGVLCGLVSARAGRQPGPILAANSPGSVTGSGPRGLVRRGGLVSAQIALALILLIGSGLLLNSFLRLMRRDLHFVPDGLVRIDYSVPSARYAKAIGSYQGYPYFSLDPAPSDTLARVLDRLRGLPGVESAAGISSPPVDSFVLANVDLRLDSPAVPAPGRGLDSAGTPQSTYFIVTPGVFATMQTAVVRGREFTDADRAAAPWVAVVNETAARRFWPGEDPIGKRLTLDIVPEEQPRAVVGVVRDVPTRHADDPQPVVYASFLQQPPRYRAPWAGLPGTMTFLLRVPGDPSAVMAAARRAIAEIDPERPVDVSTMASHTVNAMAQRRDYVLLIVAFALTATLLAAVGTYGVVSYTVSQRTREIGVRRALGASGREIVSLVARHVIALVLLGVAAGLAGALVVTQLIASQLWGITPTDPATYIGVSTLLAAVALAAAIVPARRALAVNPTQALRSE